MSSVAQDTTGTPDLTPKPKSKLTEEGENAEAPLWSAGGFGNDIATPEKAPEAEQRRADPEDEDIAEEPEYQGLSEELAIPERPHIRGLKTFGDKFMPFAAGFENMVNTTVIYRSPRLRAVNPTAALTDDVSYLYTLDSGRVTPASAAADPNYDAEHIRNTIAASKGGFMNSMLQPIK